MRRLLLAGSITGIVDGLFSSILVSFFYGSTVTRLFQGVASTLFGSAGTAPIGVLMHFGVAFAWSAIFLVLAALVPRIRRMNMFLIAAIYGPLVWCVMSLAVIPLLTDRPPTIGLRWWIQFFGHALFVGLPIVWCSRLPGPRIDTSLPSPPDRPSTSRP